MSCTKRVVIKNLDDLVEIFPNMRLSQIIHLYIIGLNRIKYYNKQIRFDASPDDEELNAILDKISFYLEITDFLAGYLARCFCHQNGYTF